MFNGSIVVVFNETHIVKEDITNQHFQSKRVTQIGSHGNRFFFLNHFLVRIDSFFRQ